MKITFFGKYGSGAGRFANEISLPNPVVDLSSIKGWPNSFAPGTFNIDIDRTRLPSLGGVNFSTNGVRCLDRNVHFKPHAYLDHSCVPNNTLHPRNKGEYAGDLQFWRSILKIEGVAEQVNCYMLRRVKSNYSYKIEVVAGCNIREKFNLVHGNNVILEVYRHAP